ncbi:hypothetical protein F5Y15DRAFT_423476 [Xylariaceae sp. FL0016]|nr:hypothetical protein F5Y15DRAFT_423476 [Xylariaceae sp. FL0016]
MASPSSTATTATPLDIPELLESILLHVDHQTLLVSCQRVNRTWHALITGSPRLQRRLFFAPDLNPERSLNPLIRRRFWPCFPASHVLYSYQERMEGLWIIVNRSECRFANASWRRMLPVQPPLRGIGSTSHWARFTTTHRNIDVEVRMDALIEFITDHPHFQGIGSDWHWGGGRPNSLALRVMWPARPPRPRAPEDTTDEQRGLEDRTRRYDVHVDFYSVQEVFSPSSF